MASELLDVLVATTPENVYYLSDYGREPPFHTGREHNAALYPREGAADAATLFVEEFELPAIAEGQSWMPQVRVANGGYFNVPEAVTDEEDLRVVAQVERAGQHPQGDRLDGVIRRLTEMGLSGGTIGFDEASVLMEVQERELLPAARLVYARDTFRAIRVVKTPEEIAALRQSNRILEVALRGVTNLVREGTSCGEIVKAFRVLMAGQGALGSHITYGGGSRPFVGSSDLSYRLKAGDVLFIDPAGEWRHYWSDLGRTAFVGEPSAKAERLYGKLRDCHEQVFPELKPGANFADLYRLTREAADGELQPGLLTVLHSMGLEQYDHPRNEMNFGRGNLVLEPNMVINFETLYFEFPWGVMQLEDTYLITEAGPEKLSTLSREPLAGIG
jgi:Xaa-Pro dipeptidase